MVLSTHIVAPPDYDYSAIVDKLIMQFGDKVLLKYVEDLWLEYSQLAKTVNAKTYRQFLTRHGLSTGRQRPVVYIGTGGNPYSDSYLHVCADYTFYVDISPQSIVDRQFRQKLAQWATTLNADELLPHIHANEAAVISELTDSLATILTLSAYKSTLELHRQTFIKAHYTPAKPGKIIDNIRKLMQRLPGR